MTHTNPTLEDVFAQLDAWRHLPAYRLEPRVDPFFAIFLRQVLERHLGDALDEDVHPELPLRIGTVYGEDAEGANQSKKVDFMLRGADGRTLYLVELKTDQGSRREEQDEYLKLAARAGWRRIVEGIVTIAQCTSGAYRQKYLHLIHRLEAMGYLDVPEGLYARGFPTVRSGIGELLAQVQVVMPGAEPQLRVVYVQPLEDPTSDAIGFEKFASSIEGSGELGALFAERLRGWNGPAGSTPVTPSTPLDEHAE